MLEIILYLVIVLDQTHNSPTTAFTEEVVNTCAMQISQELSDANINASIVVKPYRFFEKDRYGKHNSLNTGVPYFYLWRGRMYRSRRLRKRFVYIAVPPAIDTEGHYWMRGWTEGRFSMGVSEEFNHLGQARKEHSIVLCKHEVGHSLGAFHWNKEISTMHPAPLPYVTNSVDMRYNIRSLNQIARKVKRLSRRRTEWITR